LLQLYFIRHGQSTNNALWTNSGGESYLADRQTDADLTEIGQHQAEFVAKHLAQAYHLTGFDPQNRQGFGLTHLYCSLMIRAIKTGQAIAQQTGLPLVAMPEVHETGGVYEMSVVDEEMRFVGLAGHGRSFFESEYPELILPEDLPEEGWWNRDKEPRENYLDRAQSIIDRLLGEHLGTDHRVGIVMHGGIFARILTILFKVQIEKYWFLMNNCAISRVDIDEDGHVMLVYMNNVSHLPDHLVS